MGFCAMKKSTKKYLLLLIILWIIGCLLQYLFCCRDSAQPVAATAETAGAPAATATQTPPATVETPVVAEPANEPEFQPASEPQPAVAPTRLPFNLTGDGITLSGQDNFNFVDSSYVPLQPYSQALQANATKTVDYLNGSPDRQLTVVGRYHPAESNPSVFPNIGLARADQVRDYLGSLGASKRQIVLASKPYPEAVSTEDKHYLGMIDLTAKTLDDDSLASYKQSMEAVADDLRANPLTLYFKTGKNQIVLSEKQRQRLLKLSNYLDFDHTAKALVTGHTDNTGNRNNNIKLAKDRALFVADYLEKNGLKREQLAVDSKGPYVPIADNTTPEGRAKNRRVTVSISTTSP